MSKADVLLKRAAFFEKMALYSDRKVFLQSLAQGVPGAGDAVKAAMTELSQAISNWINTSAEKQEDIPGGMRGLPPGVRGPAASITQALKYPTLDANLLRQVYSVAAELAAVNKNMRNESDDVRSSWIRDVMPAAMRVMDAAKAQITSLEEWQRNFPADQGGAGSQGEGSGTLQVPEVSITGRPSAGGLPRIDKGDQDALARFVMTEGLAFVDPKKMQDGILGPETRRALEAVKDYFKKVNPQNARMTDQEAIQAAKFNTRR